MEWQPIDTAPRDGTEFQAWVARPGWCGFWEPRCRFNEDGVFGIYGRIDYDEDDWNYGLSHLSPTHWMPQPAPPITR